MGSLDLVRRAAVAEMAGTPLFDASERPHRRQDNVRGSIANSLPVKLAAYNLRTAFGTGNSAFNAKPAGPAAFWHHATNLAGSERYSRIAIYRSLRLNA